MEANWNQLIERYLENELSKEGKSAFEAELASNAELREELDLHETIRGGAVRSSQRVALMAIGASYHKTVRLKKISAAAAVVVAVSAIILVIMNSGTKQSVSEKAPIEEQHPIAQNDAVITDSTYVSDSMSTTSSSENFPVAEISFPQRTTTKFEFNQVPVIQAALEVINTNSTIGIGVSGLTPKPVEEGKYTETLYDEVFASGFPKKGYALVKKDRWYGVIDENAKLVVVPMYDSIGEYNVYACGLALIKKDNKYGMIDLTGKQVVPAIYNDYVITEYNVPKFHRGRFKRSIPGLKGYKTKNKNTLHLIEGYESVYGQCSDGSKTDSREEEGN